MWPPVGLLGCGAPRAAPCEASSCLSLLPTAPAGSCPWGGTSAGHGLSPRPPSTAQQPRRREPLQGSVGGQAVPRSTGPRLECGEQGWACGRPGTAELQRCGRYVRGRHRGGGEGGRGSSRGSSSFDKQLPEHFQTVVSDRQPEAAPTARRAAGRQPPARPHRGLCPGAVGAVHVEGQPQAGLGCWAGDVSTPPEVLPWAPRLARVSPRCFLAGQLLEWQPGLSLLRISPGAAPAEQLLWSCLDGEHPAWGVGMV